MPSYKNDNFDLSKTRKNALQELYKTFMYNCEIILLNDSANQDSLIAIWLHIYM
jgi:hypothetical protein